MIIFANLTHHTAAKCMKQMPRWRKEEILQKTTEKANKMEELTDRLEKATIAHVDNSSELVLLT